MNSKLYQKDYRYFLIPSLIFIISFTVRIFLISKGPYHVDCLRLAIKAQEILETHQISYLQSAGHPLTCILGALFIFLFNKISISDPVIAVNFMSVLMSSICVVLLYYLVEKMIEKKTALFSSLIFCINPIFLGTSVYGNSHVPSVFFVLLGLLFLFKYFEEKKNQFLVLLGILLGLGGAARLPEMVVMVVPIFVLFITQKNKFDNKSNFIKSLFCLFIVGFITVLFFYLPVIFTRFSSNSPSQFLYNLNFILETIFNPNIIFITASLKYVFLSMSFFGLAIIIFSIILFVLKKPPFSMFILFWFFIPFLFYFNLPITVPRFFIIPIIPLIIVQGYFFSYLANKSRYLKLFGVVIFLILSMQSILFIYPILEFRHRNAVLPDFYRWVGEKTENNAVILERDNSLFVIYYAKREAMTPQIKLLYNKNYNFNDLKKRLDDKLKAEIPLYITGTGLYGHNPKYKFSEFMEDNYEIDFIDHNFIEDWHRGCLDQRIGLVQLFKISKKKIN